MAKQYADDGDLIELTQAEVMDLLRWRELPPAVRKALRHFIKLRLRD